MDTRTLPAVIQNAEDAEAFLHKIGAWGVRIPTGHDTHATGIIEDDRGQLVRVWVGSGLQQPRWLSGRLGLVRVYWEHNGGNWAWLKHSTHTWKLAHDPDCTRDCVECLNRDGQPVRPGQACWATARTQTISAHPAGREHPVPCRVCRQSTWNVDALCSHTCRVIDGSEHIDYDFDAHGWRVVA